MRLVDTSAWIEWLTASPTGKAVEAEIPEEEDWLVPTMVQLELAKWLARKASEDQADRIIAFTRTCIVAPLDTRIALKAAELWTQYKLATSDAVVYATALEHHADLLTCDTHFDGLPDVILVPKAGTV
jgi:predicted nucleic acid-binding protein